MRLRKLTVIATALVAAGAFSATAFAQAQKKADAAPAAPAVKAPGPQAVPPAAAKAVTAAGAQTDQQIADAKAKGMVWVNTDSKVYHKDGKFYGKTKEGKFMTEADAQKMGARAAKASPIGKKKT